MWEFLAGFLLGGVVVYVAYQWIIFRKLRSQ